MHILVVGGAGYIGSHTVAMLLKQGDSVTIIDNFSNSKKDIIKLLEDNFGKVDLIECDLRNYADLESKLNGKHFDAVIHFAGLIEVGRSVKEPANFFDNNVVGSQNLFKVLAQIGTKNVIFSSSAAVYGTPESTPINENAKLKSGNPYATSKIIVEELLSDYCTFAGFKGISLRYFNPAGSLDGIIGESHQNESHLIPRLLTSITNPDFNFTVYGDDYPTSDGSAIRDYIHILDLANIHIAAINHLSKIKSYEVFNVGTGKGYSVLEVIKTAEKITGQKVEYKTVERRKGDSTILVAGVEKIKRGIGWQAKYTLDDIISSAWKWVIK